MTTHVRNGDYIFVKPKFFLGHEVVSKKTGLPGKGTVLGLAYGRAYDLNRKMLHGSGFASWDNQFPGWQEKFIYFVWYQEPRKWLTLEEFKRDSDLNEFDILNEYEKLPMVQLITYPEDDLEIFE